MDPSYFPFITLFSGIQMACLAGFAWVAGLAP
jgi:hypothetical protein